MYAGCNPVLAIGRKVYKLFCLNISGDKLLAIAGVQTVAEALPTGMRLA